MINFWNSTSFHTYYMEEWLKLKAKKKKFQIVNFQLSFVHFPFIWHSEFIVFIWKVIFSENTINDDDIAICKKKLYIFGVYFFDRLWICVLVRDLRSIANRKRRRKETQDVILKNISFWFDFAISTVYVLDL